MTGLITLTTAGTDTGPFDIYSDVDGYFTPFATGISKSVLLAGYPTHLIPDGTHYIRVVSINELCSEYGDITIPQCEPFAGKGLKLCHLTPFNLSSIEEVTCPTGFVETVDTEAYHDGAGPEPAYGDAVYTDCELTSYPDNSSTSKSYITATQDMQIIGGIRVEISCK